MPEPCRSDPQHYLNHRLRGVGTAGPTPTELFRPITESGGEVFLEENGELEYFGLVDSVNVLEVLPDGRFYMVWRSAYFYENDHGAHTVFVQDARADKGGVIFMDSEGRTFVMGEVTRQPERWEAWQQEKARNMRKYRTRIANQAESARMIVEEMKANAGL